MSRSSMKTNRLVRFASLTTVFLITAVLLPVGAGAAESPPDFCDWLDDPALRARLSTSGEMKLMVICGRVTATSSESVDSTPFPRGRRVQQPDILVNDPTADTVPNTTQSETSIVLNRNTVCAAWNDSGSNPFTTGFSGYGFSQDRGKTWTDAGAFPPGPGPDLHFGDPSLAHSVRDNAFYYAALSSLGLSLWKSVDDCRTFSYVGPISIAGSFFDDKELMAIDNNRTSPFFGRIYVGWTQFFNNPDWNVVSYSDDGGSTWTGPIPLPGSGFAGQGMWPAVAPNGDVYFALVRRSFAIGGTQDQWIYRSTDGGNTWTQMTDIATGQLRPENAAASTSCARQALNGDIRNLSSPQIAIHRAQGTTAEYVIHAVYPYDSDGAGADNSNVFYTQSSDGGVTWSPEVMLNDDGTTTDQWFPAIGVNQRGVVVVSWYDRRNDTTNNMLFDRYAVVSTTGGQTWGANVRISDMSSPVATTNPNFDSFIVDCYHGDYDQVAVDPNKGHIVWSDDRRATATGPNPDVVYDVVALQQAARRR